MFKMPELDMCKEGKKMLILNIKLSGVFFSNPVEFWEEGYRNSLMFYGTVAAQELEWVI